jgi:hypothetical protein
MPLFQPPPIHVVVTVAPRGKRPHQQKDQRLIIPTDLFLSGWRQLYPAERMVVFGGQQCKKGVRLTSMLDVTEAHPSKVHVNACPARFGQAVIDFERAGAHLALWMHSHPGDGIYATNPSSIDVEQERSLRETYSDRLVSVIGVKDGVFRIWGGPIAQKAIRIEWQGQGIEETREENVYKIRLS